MNCRRPEHAQRGAVLVLALLAVLVVVALATRVSRDYWLLYRTFDNQSSLEQAHAWLRGAEEVAKQALLLDVLSGSVSDSHLEAWAQRNQLPLPDGLLHACIIDLQSRLNLNDLGASAAQGYSAAQKRFIRLLQVLPLEQPLDSVAAVALANAVFDWIDADNSARYPGGAEELDYLQQGRGYRPANQAFTSTSELLQVLGMEPEVALALTPFVSVWGNGSVNFNTLDSRLLWSARAAGATDKLAAELPSQRNKPVLLRTLNNPDSLRPLSEPAAELLADARSSTGGMLDNLTLFSGGVLSQQNWELEGVGVASDYFQLTAAMEIASRHYQLQSVLQRRIDAAGRPRVDVVARTYGTGKPLGEDDCAVALR